MSLYLEPEHSLTRKGRDVTVAPVELLSANTNADLVAIARGWLVPTIGAGHAIEMFETQFARLVGNGQARSFAAGRVALAAILDALDISAGDEVLVPAYTCVAVPNPILFVGATPTYADIDPGTLNISVATVLPRLTSRTKALVVQHTFGFPAPMAELMALARRRGLAVVEDCTHALGATIDGRQVGSFGDASFFSLEQTKVVSAGSGGVAYSGNAALCSKLADFQRRCTVPSRASTRRMMGYLAYTVILRSPRRSPRWPLAGYYLERLGLIRGPVSTEEELRCEKPDRFEMRLSASQARVGSSQLRQLPDNLSRRRRLAAIYSEILGQSKIGVFQESTGAVPTYVRFPIRVAEKAALAADLAQRDIQLGLWFTAPVHPAGVPQSRAGYRLGTCPAAEAAVDEVVNLPCHPRMSESDAYRVAEAVLESPHA